MASPASRDLETVDSGTFPADHLALNIPLATETDRPQPIKHISAPAYQSPLRHHTRGPSTPRRQVKETLNARSQYSNSGDDGTAEHRINQYLIKEEIGRGSFGSVHIAVDQYGREYAVKEFSKARLRKRAQSNLLRNSKVRPKAGPFTAGKNFNSPLHRRDPRKDQPNSLDLIREEIAIMKKLNHQNVVNLIEVLDDPDEDSLYMVMEMCKKGVVMHVGLDQTADPYSEEQCRLWLRDMVLGLEYLHAQGIIHRDIKPDNCLIMDDDSLKFVDFGVSEMFEKDSEMHTAKSAGSPAFMPPELCIARHGEVSGRACDIWSMGVTLYCLRFGHIPFEKTKVLDLYESIKEDGFEIASDCNKDLAGLIRRILEKDPDKRITMDEIREHPWLTKGGTDPLLSKAENTASSIEPLTEEDLENAITGKMGGLMVVVKAAKKFKQLIAHNRPEIMESLFGTSSRFVQPPLSINPLRRSHSNDLDDRKPVERALAAEGVHREIDISDDLKRLPEKLTEVAIHGDAESSTISPDKGAVHEAEMLRQTSPLPTDTGRSSPSNKLAGRGHAHDPLEDTLYLGVGVGEETSIESGAFAAVSESPGATDFNVYEKAYQEEVDRILAKQKPDEPDCCLFLTRRVEHITSLRNNEHIIDHLHRVPAAANLGFKKLVEQAKSNYDHAAAKTKPDPETGEGGLKEKLKENVEAAKARASVSEPRSSEPETQSEEQEASKSRFGALLGKAKQSISAVRTSKG